MSITTHDKRIMRDVAQKALLETNRKLESTLMPGVTDNQELCEILARLSKATTPRNVAPSRRKVEEIVDPLTLLFYARRAEDFTGRRGRVGPRKARESARIFRFEGPVTILRCSQDGRFFYRLSEGPRSLMISQRGTEKTGYTYHVMRSDGFVLRSNRAAGFRSSGRDPRAETE